MVDSLVYVLIALLGLLGTLLVGVLSNELFAWIPALNRRIVRAASLRLRDPRMRERFSEEWEATLAEIAGPLFALVHSISLFLCVRRVERNWAAGLTAADVQDHFADLSADILKFGNTLAEARGAVGLSLEEVAAVTKIHIRMLRAFERGKLNQIPSGIFERAHLREFARVIGLNPDTVWAMYCLLFRSGGLAPVPKTKRRNILAILTCRLCGHRAMTKYLHSDGSPMHLAYRECERCGASSTMWSGQCHGRKVQVKRHADLPAETAYSCEVPHPASSWLEPEEERAALTRGLTVTASRRNPYSAGRDN